MYQAEDPLALAESDGTSLEVTMTATSDQPPSNPLGQHLLAAAREDTRTAPSEDSAMFTLDRLMAGAVCDVQEPANDPAEDSGLINLTALSQAASTMPAVGMSSAWPGDGHFPLGPPTPPGAAPTTPVADDVRKSSPSGRFAVYALSAAALLLAAAVLFLLIRGPKPTTNTIAADSKGASSQLPSDPSDPSNPSNPARAPAEPAGAATASSLTGRKTTETGPASATPIPTRSPPLVRPPPPSTAGTPAAAPTKTKQAPRDDCPCPPNDLDCHMRCAVRNGR